MVKNNYYYLVKNMFLFSLIHLFPKLLAMLLLPICTAILSTGEYGIFELMISTINLLVPLLTLNIYDAILRFSMDQQYSRAEILSVGIKVFCAGSFILLSIVTILSLCHIPSLKPGYLLFFSLTFLSTAAQMIVSRFCKAIERVDALTVGSFLSAVTTLCTCLLFLLVFRWGLYGYLLSNILGSFVSLLYCFWRVKLKQYLKLQTSRLILRQMLSYSMPLILNEMAWWLTISTDRYLLSWFCGVSVSGIYAIAFKIPNLFSSIQSVFSQAWSISALKEFDPEDSEGFISNIYHLQNFGAQALCSLLLIFNLPLVSLLYAGEFTESWRYTPLLLLSLVFFSAVSFMDQLLLAAKATRPLSFATLLAATVNLVGNLLLIPKLGAYGAAISTLACYLTMFLFRHILLRHHLHFQVKRLRNSCAYILIILQTALACQGWSSIPYQSLLFILICLLYFKELHSILRSLYTKIKNTEKD